jgi:glycosyltransferase involved in cell wall biosynthesis
MSRKRIAVLVDWYLPGTRAGGPVRSLFSLVNLLKDEFDFYIVTTNLDLGSRKPYSDVTPDSLFEKEGVHYYYFSRTKLTRRAMRELLNSIDADLVYLNSFWSFYFSILILMLKRGRRLRAPVLLAPRGMLSTGALGLKSLKKRIFIFVSRLLGWHSGIVFHATTSQESVEIKTLFPAASVHTAANVNALSPLRRSDKKEANSVRFFYLSRIARVKNLHFALEALAVVPSDVAVSYDIYGNLEEASYWETCREIIRRLPDHVKVTYKGEIAFHHIQPVISQYHALLLPTLNENFGHSIVESLLSGCLVVISDQTPWNDVERAGAGFALPLSDARPFAIAVEAIARMDAAAFGKASEKAIEYISHKIDFKKTADDYRRMFYGCIEDQSRQFQ